VLRSTVSAASISTSTSTVLERSGCNHPMAGVQAPVILGHETAGYVSAGGVVVDPIRNCGTCPPCRVGMDNLCDPAGHARFCDREPGSGAVHGCSGRPPAPEAAGDDDAGCPGRAPRGRGAPRRTVSAGGARRATVFGGGPIGIAVLPAGPRSVAAAGERQYRPWGRWGPVGGNAGNRPIVDGSLTVCRSIRRVGRVAVAGA
jgi:threonine dehydrogenase-like Zn-dependent dehydrogenase